MIISLLALLLVDKRAVVLAVLRVNVLDRLQHRVGLHDASVLLQKKSRSL